MIVITVGYPASGKSTLVKEFTDKGCKKVRDQVYPRR